MRADSGTKPRRFAWDPKLERLLFWVPFLSFAYFYQGADQSTAARFDLMRSIIERRTLWIDNYCGLNTADIVFVSGHYYSVKAPGGAFSGILQWLFFTILLSPLHAEHESLYWALTTWLTIIFSVSLIVALSCVAMYRLVIALGGTAGRAAVCALLLPFATIMFPYATEMTGEPIAGACALIAFYLLATHATDDSKGRALLAGMLAGWAVLCDFPAMLIALALAVYAVRRLRWSAHVTAFSAGAISVAIILLAYNQAAFSHPLFLSYQAYKLTGNTEFPEQAVGFVGLTYPRFNVLQNILILPQRGLLYGCPVLILCVPGWWYMARQRALRNETVLVIFAALAMILFNASFGESIVSWGGGTATGPRQIAAAMPFLVLPIAFLPRGWGLALGALAALSVLAMLMATAIEPHFPYEYDNPLRDFVWPAYLRGDFAYDRDAFFSNAAIVDESTAFNPGKLLGLPGPLQLWPLGILWIAGAWLVLKRCDSRAPAGPGWRVAVSCLIAMIFAPPLVGTWLNHTKIQPANGLRGRYYRGLKPDGFPPHIDRVDRYLSFKDVAELGALPAPSRVVWSGTLTVQRSALYRFMVQADDSGWLKIDGNPVVPDPGPVERAIGVGDIYLSAGRHRIDAGETNLGGDAAMTLFWAPVGGYPQVVAPTVLTPD